MKHVFLFILIIISISGNAQQIADTSYHPTIIHPAYAKGKGPVIFIDEGHHNFHTKTGRYLPFANLLERDGYQVDALADEFTKKNLAKGKILVISNALNEINEENWYLPTPSAFSKAEIMSVKNWVHEGGSLFLIADHMPMAGAAQDLAAAFGFEIANGFVLHTVTNGIGYFNLTDGSLIESPITLGRDSSERVKQIVSFTGQGFKIPPGATSILTFDEKYECMMPDTAWVFPEGTPRINMKGWSQGAYLKYGKGRVVLFGEAAMFTAQLSGELQTKVGMNSDKAPENFKLLLNIVHWLDGKLE
ncbi:MAG: DUF4350 domain-containing protein [Saprospiraceae bacterium]|uniref:DUF4350 domain-containing protein n=1 Tax=Candidatus Opimibacter skivensis TaxID=2982028 RepID=A0A9D7SWY5_9BACT|nr:DUF4350 domain-containing protein [Candidatus Opimibacter skivensis]